MLGCTVALNCALLSWALREGGRSGKIGKLLLLASTLVYFNIEGLGAGLQETSFGAPRGLAVTSGQYGSEIVRKAVLLISLFQLCLYLGYASDVPCKRIQRWAAKRRDRGSRMSILWRILFVFCIFIGLLGYSGFDVTSAWGVLIASYRRLETGLQGDSIWESLISIGLYGAGAAFVAGLQAKNQWRYGWYLLGLCAVGPIVMRGTRHQLLFSILPVIVVLWRRLSESNSRSRVLNWIAAAVVCVSVLQLQLAIRASGWDAISYLSWDKFEYSSTTGQFQALLFAEYLVPDHHEYFCEPVEPFFITHWVPRKIWPDKPVMQSWQYYNVLATNNSRNWNVTPSVIGQYYMNWGIVGVLGIGWWLGALTSIADRIAMVLDNVKQQALTVSIGMIYAFIVASFRFYAPYYAAYVVIGLACTMIVSRRRRPASQLDYR